MSPLVRTLLALACLAVLHDATAEKVCFKGTIDSGDDGPSTHERLNPFFVTAGLSTLVNIPNNCHSPPRLLLSEDIEVCNEKGYELEIIPPKFKDNIEFSPVTVNCYIKVDHGYRIPCYHTEYELEVRVIQKCTMYL